eukprot:scaffold14445_cov127-Isochrysis_galbana.AAC.3
MWPGCSSDGIGVAFIIVVADGDHDDDGARHDGERERAIEESGIEDCGEDDRAGGGDGLHDRVGILDAERHKDPAHAADEGANGSHRCPTAKGRAGEGRVTG